MSLSFKLFTIITLLLGTTLNAQVGVFEKHNDIGNVLHPGTVHFEAATGHYLLSGSGTNIWGTHDEFHYVWKRMKGDFIVQARGSFLGKGADPHRKFGWMVRSNLDTNSAMVGAVVHGDGLNSLQFRKSIGGNVEEVKSTVTGPDMIQLEKKGNRYIMSTAHFGETFTTVDVNDVDLGSEVYVGLFVCAHHNDVTERVHFDNVRITVPTKETFVPYKEYLGSNLELLTLSTGDRQIIYSSPQSLQAPNFLKDGQSLIYNSNGTIYRYHLKKKTTAVINTDFVKNNNNDHVVSFNGKMLGLSSSSGDSKFGSMIYVVPVNGGTPKQITPTGPSYLHGWSPDGKVLTFTGQRNKEFDIYTIPSSGGKEVQLTNAPGLDDGPEYSPDGRYIYFNSVRSGLMQLWRMKPDGSGQEQLTNDEFNNWFPHISPDGKWIVFLSFLKDVPPGDHPFYKQVYLRLIPISGGKPKVVAYVYGGQGTINTPSWHPDGKKIAFVSNSDVKE